MSNCKHDIDNREDVVLMVNTFYQRVQKDELIGPLFEERIKGNREPHLATMHNFWFTLLFGQEAYRGNPFAKHIGLPISEEHFQRWLSLFNNTPDNLFEGERKELAQKKAANIAQIFHAKLSGQLTGKRSP